MRFRKTKDEEENIGIAPLVDIVFLLLIFFMVTSHYDIAAGVQIKLPKITKKAADPDAENRVIITVDKDAAIYIEGEKIDISALEQRLTKEIKERGVLDLVLQADVDVSHGNVVKIMDIAKNAGINSIVIAARWRSKELM
ncbi:MAG: biopolymer transporter ExbD [Desulfatiglans sp.]|jgi:biopolymer transport protein ExbD|nr:biopolymer transporter ExbD [Desulfatiglans sp.]